MNVNPCEETQMALSALIDGEIEPLETLPTIDHLVDCAACRSFYGRARAIDGLALEALTTGAREAAPEELWQRIRSAGAASLRVERKHPSGRTWPAWASAVAASLVLAVGLTLIALEGARQAVGTADGEVLLAADRGAMPAMPAMNDERLAGMARELLQADRRYQHEMLDVLRTVTSKGVRREGTLETSASSREGARGSVDGPEAGAAEAVRRAGPDARPGPRS